MARNNIDLRSLGQKLLFLLTHNWQWKLISLLIAVCLWSGLITQDGSLTREKIFSDVSLNVLNADTLRRNGYIIVSGLDNLPSVRMRVDVPQRVYNSVTAANYNVRVDLSRIREAGEQKLNVIATSSTTYGTVTEISVATITVQVEKYVTINRIPVRLNVSGEAPEGFYASDARVDPSYVVISGPESLAGSVVRCVADYNMSILTPVSGTERTAVPFRLVDANGNEVDRSLIDVTSESVLLSSMVVEQTLYKAKTLVINTTDLTAGKPADGYVIKRITTEPSMLTVAGTDQFMSTLNELHLVEYLDADQFINVTGATDEIKRKIRLVKNDNIAYFSSDTILVVVEIAAE